MTTAVTDEQVRELADGAIAILCPVSSDTLAGTAILDVPPERAREIMNDDPCVRAGMMRLDIYPCHGFPGDTLSEPSPPRSSGQREM